MSNIRVNYSGLIAFIVGLIGVFFGLFYSLIVTRSLAPEEFGTWSLILSVVNYFLISEIIVSFWSTRQTARGEKIGKNSIFSSTMLSFVCVPIFLAYVFLISESNNANFEILIFGAILLPLQFVGQTLNGLNLGHKPHAASYGLLIFEIIRIPLIFLTIVILNMGVIGVVLAIFFALLAKIAVQSYYAAPHIRSKLNFSIVNWWIKFSWVPLFLKLQNYVRLLDVVLYSVVIGSVLGIAYYGAALTVAAIVGHSGVISQALYPKLLAENKFEGIKKNLNTVLYFAIPLLGIAIVFSKPGLYALNPIYQDAWPIVILLSFKIFAQSLRKIPVAIIQGKEQIDTQENLTFSQIIKSNLFYVPKVLLIFNISYIVILVVMLFSLKSSFNDELELVYFWVLLGVIVEVPLVAYLWFYSRKYGTFSFPIKNIIKYTSSTIIIMVFFTITSDYILIYENNIYKFLPFLILELSLCVGIYLVITYLISTDTRTLFKSVLNEFKNRTKL